MLYIYNLRILSYDLTGLIIAANYLELLLGDGIEILINLNNSDMKHVRESKDTIYCKRTENSTFNLHIGVKTGLF